MIILVVFLVLIGCWWAYWYARAHRMDQMTAALPIAPYCFPILGNGSLFVGSTEKILQNMEQLVHLAYNHNGSIKLWLGPKLYVAITSPEDSQVILDNCLDKDVVYRFLRPWLGYGLFVAPLNLWKVHRRELLPAFHKKIVEEYVGVVGEQADILVTQLSRHCGQGEFDVFKYITACTLDIVFETAMGERMDVQHSPETPYLNARNTVMTILNMRLFKVWLQPDSLFNLTPYAKQQKDNIDLTHKFTDEVVKKKRNELENYKDSSDKSPASKPRTVLDMLFDREISFTNEQLREHIDSITIAGNDTTALVIAYTLCLLGVHQQVQEKAYAEQQELLGVSKTAARKEDLHKMQYLERVIKESMRFYTVVPIIARNVDKDTYLPKCGVTVPAGAGAVVAAFAVHRSPAAWGPTADCFDPDRFLPERSSDRHSAAFLPFSYGTRNCIGRNYGMIIIKSIISTVLRNYKIEAEDIGPLKIEMLLFPIRGHQIKISRR